MMIILFLKDFSGVSKIRSWRGVFHLAEISLAGLYPLWCETLRDQSKQTRTDLLSDLGALAPVIAALGGPEALEDTAQAIEDVGHWWP
jgi:hypothetical protein